MSQVGVNTSRRRAALVTMAVLLAGTTACGQGGAPDITARMSTQAAGANELDGEWAATTTSTTTTTAPPKPAAAPMDPSAGLGIAGPIGPPWPTEFTAADVTVPTVDLYQSPGVRVPTGRSLSNPTHEGVPLYLSVRKEEGDWLQVQIPSRPNGATAWIKRSDVRLRTVSNHVVIELGAKRATVYHGDTAIWSASVAPGKSSSPTPTGSFYVDVISRPTNKRGPYGLYQVSISGYSNVYDSFAGGNGQVAMHGTNRPELIGTAASNGCVRFSNDDISVMVSLAPQGTPVDVVA